MMRIVLDIDDTLYLERDYVRSGFMAVDAWLFSACGAGGFFERAWNYFTMGRRGDIFNQVIRDIDIDENEWVAKMVAEYRTHDPEIQLIPDAVSFLNRYAPSELAVISDGHSVSQWAKVRRLNLEPKVGNIIITGDWGTEYWKPHHRAFETVQQGCLPQACVYIADNPLKDFLAPATLGWRTSIRIRRPGSLHEAVPTPDNCIEVATLDEAGKVLNCEYGKFIKENVRHEENG